MMDSFFGKLHTVYPDSRKLHLNAHLTRRYGGGRMEVVGRSQSCLRLAGRGGSLIGSGGDGMPDGEPAVISWPPQPSGRISALPHIMLQPTRLSANLSPKCIRANCQTFHFPKGSSSHVYLNQSHPPPAAGEKGEWRQLKGILHNHQEEINNVCAKGHPGHQACHHHARS